MSLLATFVFGIGPAIAKALLTHTLEDYPVIKDIAPELLDWLRDRAKAERGSYEEARRMAAIGEAVAVSMLPVLSDAQLDNNGRVVVLRELLLTLDQANIGSEHLIESRLDPQRLATFLTNARPTATATLTASQTAVYRRLLSQASLSIRCSAAEIAGYTTLRDASLLQDQELLLSRVEALIRQPNEACARFEAKYREVVQRELDKLELFGVRRLAAATKRQSLSVAYVTVQVDRNREQRFSSDSDNQLLQKLLGSIPETVELPEREQRVTGPIDDVLVRERRIVVRGDPGSGKTTLLQWIAVTSAAKKFSGALGLWNNTIPFFIRLRQVVEQGFPTPDHYVEQIAKTIAGGRPYSGWEHDQLDNGRAVVLIDGVDELPIGKREAFLEQLKDLVRDYRNARYLITSRPAAVSKQSWPEWHEWTQEERFSEVEVQQMNATAINEFIDHWHTAYAQGSTDPEEQADIQQAGPRLKMLLNERPNIRRLAANPLLCAMISALHYEKRNRLPSERIKLYEECIDMLLEQRDAARGISMADYPELGNKQKLALLQDLAFRMMRNGETEVSVEMVDTRFEEFLPKLGGEISSIQRLRRYFVERSGLLREPITGQIDFRHRTFQEFFTAQAIAKGGEVRFLLTKARDDQWRETVTLTAGLLGPTDSSKLLRGLLHNAQLIKSNPSSNSTATKSKRSKRGDSQSRQRHLRSLALACLETAIEVEPRLRQEVLDAASDLFPPYAHEQQRMIVLAGEVVIPYLQAGKQPNIAASTACIHVLGQIGGPKALAEIERYALIKHEAIERAIDAVWSYFEYEDFARRFLAQRIEIHIDEPALLVMLTQLPNLQELIINAAQIIGLASLVQLPNLQRLSLYVREISDFGSLAQLINLQQLSLGNTQVSDLAPLAQLTNLQQLFLYKTQVSDLAPLAQLTNLQQLSLSSTQVSDLTPLAQLTNLQQLSLSSTQVSDFTPLAQLTNLQQLSLDDTPISDLTPLVQLTNLQQLSLFGTQVSDLTPLAQLANLQQLTLFNMQISDLVPLAQLTNLQQLTLYNIQVSDLTPLAQLTNLQQLTLFNMQISDLVPLAQLTNLQHLTLFDTQASDLTPLVQLPHLVRVTIV